MHNKEPRLCGAFFCLLCLVHQAKWMFEVLRRVFITIGILLTASFPVLLNADQKPVVVWAIIPYAPIHIIDGEFKGQGIADNYVRAVQQAIPDYQHINQVMTPARAWQLIASSSDLVCHPTALKTQAREQVGYFSHATIVTPVIRVLMRKTDWKSHLNSRNNLRFDEYIDANPGNFGIVRLRSYGQLIDDAIEQGLVAQNRLMYTSGRYGSRQLFEMLLNKRIDMMLEYPWVSAYFASVDKDGLSKSAEEELVSLTISDFPGHTPAYVACSKTQSGRQFLNKLDQFIKARIPEQDNRKRMKRWLDATSARQFEKAYQEYFQVPRAKLPEYCAISNLT